MYYTYVLKSAVNGDLYIGYTEDLKRRLAEHNAGKMIYTSAYKPWILVYYEAYKSKKDATKREKQLKNHRAKVDLKYQLKHSLSI